MKPDWATLAGIKPGIDDARLQDGERVEFTMVNNDAEMPGWALSIRGANNAIWYRLIRAERRSEGAGESQ